ncbi:acyltransferase family protein [Albibacterium indicum]|uniref:acyltransferase family protein n=1 Tax=Albibacterium indicum TaxID=2292082 RepID=UPI000E482DFB
MKISIKSLRRITSKGEFIPEIDGLRFLAITPVVLMHADTNYLRTFDSSLHIQSDVYNQIINDGWKGVWLFFGISGFILSYFFAKHFYINKRSMNELNLRTYYVRRLTRLEPPFLISMTIFFIFSALYLYDFKSLFSNFLGSITYLHNIIFGRWSPINPVTWSLEVEVQFYMLAPFLSAFFFLLKENLRNFLLCAFIIAIPLVVLHENSLFITNPHLSMTIPVFIQHFLVGILFTSIYTGSYWERIRKNNFIWDIITVIAIIFIFTDNTISHFAFDLCLLLILIGAFKGTVINKIFCNSIVTTIGGMCYSIYLIHYGIIYGLSRILGLVTFKSALINYLFHMTITMIVVLFISVIFYKYFERPFMDRHWPHKLRTRIEKIIKKSKRLSPIFGKSILK